MKYKISYNWCSEPELSRVYIKDMRDIKYFNYNGILWENNGTKTCCDFFELKIARIIIKGLQINKPNGMTAQNYKIEI